jgi:hypothetical protein
MTAEESVRPPTNARRTYDGLAAIRRKLESDRLEKLGALTALSARIERAPKVEAALKQLSDSLFQQVVGVVERQLTIALQEILGQPIVLKAEVAYKHNAPSVEFHIERDGKVEHIMKGQGGSVANILSVGLRMFALATLDAEEHRPFLVLDEQDCWLRPELVPMLVKIVRDACKELGFQVLMISHHDHRLFEEYADRVYRLVPQPDASVRVEMVVDHVD